MEYLGQKELQRRLDRAEQAPERSERMAIGLRRQIMLKELIGIFVCYTLTIIGNRDANLFAVQFHMD
jgi:hypothetical protein